MTKKALLTAVLLLVLAFSVLILSKTNAQEQPVQVCGDDIIQSPNNNGEYEKCDGTNGCTAECGQKMLGWAWSDVFGWLSLSEENCDFLPEGVCENSGGTYVQVAAGQMIDGKIRSDILGWAWSDNIGWVCFGQTCIGNAGQTPPGTGGWQAYAEQEGNNDPLVYGWAWNDSLGLISLSCGASSVPCEISNYQIKLVQSSFGEDKQEQRLTLLGWAWSDISGWISFTPDVSQISPWLQTKYGDIYARKGISGQAPPDYGYNATYQIISGNVITNFRSAQGEDWIRQEFQGISFPQPSTRYSNVLGKLNVSDLLCDFSAGNVCVNKAGKTVVKLPTENYYGGNVALDGKIYYRSGNLVVANLVEFVNSSGFSDGSGTIIVDGDLIIRSDVKYDDSDNLSRFKNLASVAWVVLGDLKVSPEVRELAGNFIVIGNGQDCSQIKETEIPHCGQIYSCCVPDGENCLFEQTACQQNPLVVSGLMMARKFYLNRTFINESREVKQGSEIIIYDGRLLANTPPGLGDFAKAMPVWRLDNSSQ